FAGQSFYDKGPALQALLKRRYALLRAYYASRLVRGFFSVEAVFPFDSLNLVHTFVGKIEVKTTQWQIRKGLASVSMSI
uniref:hypothetical protein n=1 Tax=Prevotella heparinolytica TaxID=28113 RepID=UPI0035A00F64